MKEGSGKVVVFVTTSSEEEAEKIASLLLEKRKAACVNIIPRVNSRFWWQGKLDSAQESLLIIKSRAALVPQIIDIVKIMQGEIVDISHTTMTVELSDRPEKVDLLIELLSHYNIVEVARTGTIALQKGAEIV